MQQSFLTVKLYELEKQHGKLQAGIRICQKESLKEIRREIARVREECEEQDFLLNQSIETSHSKAVTALADAQVSYDETVKTIVEKVLPEAMHGKDSMKEELAEEKMLYAEYSIDFAIRAVKNALQTSLEAIEAQMECEEWRRENE